VIGDNVPWRMLALGLALGLGAASSSACRVINPDHCANQAMPGNQWCATLSSTLQFCDPCVAEFHGCVASEPVACPDYVGDDGGDDTGGTAGATSMTMMTTVGTLGGSGSDGAMTTMGADTTMGDGMDTMGMDTMGMDTAMDTSSGAAESTGDTTGGDTAMGSSSGESTTG